MPEDANVILNEFYDITESKEQLEQFIEKYKDNPEAEPVIKIATQALNNFSTTNKPIVKKDESVIPTTDPKKHNIRHTVLEPVSDNPLMHYHRPPGVYVVLPSKGNFYSTPPKLSGLNEVLVKPMTARDELLFKSPDILMNGESLIEVIKSCVPGISDPNEIPAPDFDVLMLAIRLVTYGKDLGYKGMCYECNTVTEFNVDVEFMLDTQITGLNNEYKIQLDELTVFLRPYDLRCNIQSALANFERSAITNNILSDNDTTDAEKQIELSKSLRKITEITYELVLRSIIKVNTPNATIEDKQLIAEWLHDVGRKSFGKISEKILEITNVGFKNTVDFVCEKCSEENSSEIVYDPTLFFG